MRGLTGYAWAHVPARVQAASSRRQHGVVPATGRERVGRRAAPLRDARGLQLRPRRRRRGRRALAQAGRQHPAPLLARGDRWRRQRRSAPGMRLALRRGLRAAGAVAAPGHRPGDPGAGAVAPPGLRCRARAVRDGGQPRLRTVLQAVLLGAVAQGGGPHPRHPGPVAATPVPRDGLPGGQQGAHRARDLPSRGRPAEPGRGGAVLRHHVLALRDRRGR